MSNRTAIEWTDVTWNPMRGCTKISDGCKHCYAETFAERFRGVPGHPYEQGFDLRLVPEKLDEPLRLRKPSRILVGSMSDVFHEGVPDKYIRKMFGVMSFAGRHTFQVLTKRADRMASFFADPANSLPACQAAAISSPHSATAALIRNPGRVNDTDGNWPLPNVWLGISAENQKYADERIPHLLLTPAKVRFLSLEPLLDMIDLHAIWTSNVLHGGQASLDVLAGRRYGGYPGMGSESDWTGDCPRIDWVIVGGESGFRAQGREIDRRWVQSIRDGCVQAGVPFFFKQWGGVRKAKAGRVLDGRTWDEMPISC